MKRFHLRRVLVEGSAAEAAQPRSDRCSGPSSSLCVLHPDPQPPPLLPPPWTGGLGSAEPLRSMSAADGSNVEEKYGGNVSERTGRRAVIFPRWMWMRGGFIFPSLVAWSAGDYRKHKTGGKEAKQEQLTEWRHISSPDRMKARLVVVALLLWFVQSSAAVLHWRSGLFVSSNHVICSIDVFILAENGNTCLRKKSSASQSKGRGPLVVLKVINSGPSF